MKLLVSAIDTDAGKTIATGLIARFLGQQGRSVITQKLVQTGCDDVAEDVRAHRRIMGVDWTDSDRNGDTCPYVFPLAASPHLAAESASAEIDLDVIMAATARLSARYEDVIIEGVGGVCVPLTRDYLLADYMVACGCRTVLVTSARLGSINHTLLSLSLLKHRGVDVAGLIYNRYFDACDTIAEDSREYFKQALAAHGYPAHVIDIPHVDQDPYPDIDFGPLFQAEPYELTILK